MLQLEAKCAEGFNLFAPPLLEGSIIERVDVDYNSRVGVPNNSKQTIDIEVPELAPEFVYDLLNTEVHLTIQAFKLDGTLMRMTKHLQ